MRIVLFFLLIAGSSLAQNEFDRLLIGYNAKRIPDPTTDENTTLRDYFTFLLYKFDLKKIAEIFTKYYFSAPFADLMRTLAISPTCHRMCRDLQKLPSFQAQRSWLEAQDVDVVSGIRMIKDGLDQSLSYTFRGRPTPIKDLWEELLKVFNENRVIDTVERFRSENENFEEFYQRVQLDSPEMQAVLEEIVKLPIWPKFNSTLFEIGTDVRDLKEIWPLGAMFVLSVSNVGC